MLTNKFTIEIVKGSIKAQPFVFTQKKIYIGSNYAQNDLILNVEGISARHARIRRKKQDFYIENLSDAPFVVGDGISLGSTKSFKLESGTAVDMGAAGIRLIHGPTPDTPDNKQENQKPLQGGISGLRLAPNHSRIKRMAVIGGVLGLLLVMILTGNCRKTDPKGNNAANLYPAASSQEPISLPAKGIYGYTQNNDKGHPDKAIFTFSTDASNVELCYTAGGIDSEQEVSIHLNGQHIGFAPLAKGVWGDETVVRLPNEVLKKGDVNHLVFDNMENPPNFDHWGVRNIQIKTLAENLCDLDKAGKLMELGKEMYEQKTISKGNLYLANKYYGDAISYMLDCSKNEDLFKQAEMKEKQTRQELDALHHNLKFAFQKAYKMNNYSQCIAILQNVVLSFPDPLDERHKKAAVLLEQYDSIRNK